ncbi:MAG: hypothetical protein E7812_07685 [Phenylobacterium sp.]|nr:MAG: hypothetical protein E7812_07685 [Phenylobacterium sp.]
MPYDPVDPASLEGEDLTSWYLRSPEEIEQQRQAAAQQRYNAFFNGGRSSDPPVGGQADPDAYSSDQPPAFGDASDGAAPGLQKASYVVPAGAASDASCPTCHAPLKPYSPPPQPQWPSLPSGWNPVFPAWPMLRDIAGGGGSSKPPEPDRKQCEMQEERDGQICGRQPESDVRAVCRQRAMVRYKHCRDTGEVDSPISLLWF